ncbi:MAG TPA: hypothetical protein VLI05_01220 [Candidatus Saccharimonadia bacterium]|nr:hypothetical protein [Candidatus Saccharimonadia bacterium]
MSMRLTARLYVLREQLKASRTIPKQKLLEELEDILRELKAVTFADLVGHPSSLDALLFNLRRQTPPLQPPRLQTRQLIELLQLVLAELPSAQLVSQIPDRPALVEPGDTTQQVREFNCLIWSLILLRERLEARVMRGDYAIGAAVVLAELQTLRLTLPAQAKLLTDLEQALASGPERPPLSRVIDQVSGAVSLINDVLLDVLPPRFGAEEGRVA